MKCTLAFAVFLGLSKAHQIVTHFHYGGKADQSCVRVASSTNPIIDLQSEEMACNAVRSNGASKCVVKAGDEVGFEWRAEPNTPAEEVAPNARGENIGVTDTSHMGPCFVYAKKVSDSLTAEGPGDGWFKIAEDGLDGNGVFCTTRLRESNAPQTIKIPANMESGDYLLRAEFLTLNNAGSRKIGGQAEPQVYPGCVQVTIEGSGTAKPSETVSIPGYYQFDQSTEQGTQGLIFDVWNSETFSDYPMPGPALFSADGSSSNPQTPTIVSSSSANTAPTSSPESEEPLEPSKAPVTAAPTAPVGVPSPAPAAPSSTRRKGKGRTRTRTRTQTAVASEPTQVEEPTSFPTADPIVQLPEESENTEDAGGDEQEIPQVIPTAPVIAEPIAPLAPSSVAATSFVTVTRSSAPTTQPTAPAASSTPETPAGTPAGTQCGRWCRFLQEFWTRVRKYMVTNRPRGGEWE